MVATVLSNYCFTDIEYPITKLSCHVKDSNQLNWLYFVETHAFTSHNFLQQVVNIAMITWSRRNKFPELIVTLFTASDLV